jgi:hypothetical protein
MLTPDEICHATGTMAVKKKIFSPLALLSVRVWTPFSFMATSPCCILGVERKVQHG